MSQLLILLILAASFITTLSGGVGLAFVLIYLPAIVLFNHLPEVNVIPHVPIAAQFAPLYGMLLAMPFRRESLKFHWCIVDTVIVLLLISATATAWVTEWYETALMTFRNDFLMWYAPYFLARISFQKVQLRATALNVFIVLIGILSFAALIEFRLQPYWYLHMLQRVGLSSSVPAMAYHRYGFNRVAGPVAHPIYFGNMCLVMLGLIAVLATTSGRKLTHPWVLLGLFGAVGCLLTSISGTPYVGLAAAVSMVVFLLLPGMRMFVLPMAMCIFLGLFVFSYHLAHSALAERHDSELAGSYAVRQVIVQQSWKRVGNAGFLGYGRDLHGVDANDDFDLSSVDNSYFMLGMTRGWVYLSLWVSVGVLMALRTTLAFAKVTHKSQVLPLVLGISTALATMVSMYTVWAGALYVVIWMILLGLCNTLIDLVLYPQPRVMVPPGTVSVTVRTVPAGAGVGLLPGRAALHGRTA